MPTLKISASSLLLNPLAVCQAVTSLGPPLDLKQPRLRLANPRTASFVFRPSEGWSGG